MLHGEILFLTVNLMSFGVCFNKSLNLKKIMIKKL